MFTQGRGVARNLLEKKSVEEKVYILLSVTTDSVRLKQSRVKQCNLQMLLINRCWRLLTRRFCPVSATNRGLLSDHTHMMWWICFGEFVTIRYRFTFTSRVAVTVTLSRRSTVADSSSRLRTAETHWIYNTSHPVFFAEIFAATENVGLHFLAALHFQRHKTLHSTHHVSSTDP